MLKKFKRKKVLVIGGDSRLGKVLKKKLSKNFIVYETTRKIKKSKKSIFLELGNIKNFKTNILFDFVIVAGGVTDYKICNNNYDYAYKINCKNIPEIAKYFIKKGSFLVFISTNTVFKYLKKIPDEYDKPNPSFNYSKLKFITEKKIFKIAKKNNFIEKFAILRLSKNVDMYTSPFNIWVKSLRKNKKFQAFEDLYFAPILFDDSASVIIKIINKKLSGIFHLSGEKDFNYYAFAKLLEKKFNKKNIVSKINSNNIGIKLIYNHYITSLKMKRTNLLLKHKPIKINKIINYLKG